MGRRKSDAEKQLLSLSYYSEFERILDEMFISPRQKEICRLYYFEKKTFAEIAYSSDIINVGEQAIGKEIRDFSLKLAKYLRNQTEFDKQI